MVATSAQSIQPGLHSEEYTVQSRDGLVDVNEQRLKNQERINELRAPAQIPPNAPFVAGLANLGSVTPETLIAFVQMQLNDLDGQIQALANKIEDRRKGAYEINQLQQFLTRHKDEEGSNLSDGQGMAQLRQLADSLTDPTAKQIAADMLETFQDGKISEEEHKTFVMRLENEAADVSRQTDTDRLKLQSLVQTRSQVLMFASQVVASLQESAGRIIDNIG